MHAVLVQALQIIATERCVAEKRQSVGLEPQQQYAIVYSYCAFGANVKKESENPNWPWPFGQLVFTRRHINCYTLQVATCRMQIRQHTLEWTNKQKRDMKIQRIITINYCVPSSNLRMHQLHRHSQLECHPNLYYITNDNNEAN